MCFRCPFREPSKAGDVQSQAVPADVGTTEGRQLVAQRVAELCQGAKAARGRSCDIMCVCDLFVSRF